MLVWLATCSASFFPSLFFRVSFFCLCILALHYFYNTLRDIQTTEWQCAMCSRDRRFIVEILASELKKIFSWVLKSPSEETGGDLFGLWNEGQDDSENKLCIYHVSGPGKLCRRTPFSFDQDVRYSNKIATYLSQQHGLDHVAVWHSHQSAL